MQPHRPFWAARFGAHWQPGALSWKATSSSELFPCLPVVPHAPWPQGFVFQYCQAVQDEVVWLLFHENFFQGGAAVPLGRFSGSWAPGKASADLPMCLGSLLQMELLLLPRRQVELSCCLSPEQRGHLTSCVWSTLVMWLFGSLHHLCLPEPLHPLQRPPKSFGKAGTKRLEKLSSIEGSRWEVELVGVEAPQGLGLSSSLPGEFGRAGCQATVIFLGCRVGKVQPSSPWVCHWLVLAFLPCAPQGPGTEEPPLWCGQSSEKERQAGMQ